MPRSGKYTDCGRVQPGLNDKLGEENAAVGSTTRLKPQNYPWQSADYPGPEIGGAAVGGCEI